MEAALLAAVLSDPADDMPRLIYADWLDENGQGERAEFIRVQIELARIQRPVLRKVTGEDPSTIPDPLVVRHASLRSREWELLERGLLRHLPGPFWRRGAEYGWWMGEWNPKGLFAGVSSRGFVESIACTAADWLAHAKDVLAACPVRKVRLTTPMTFGLWFAAGKPVDGYMEHLDWKRVLEAEWPTVEFEPPPWRTPTILDTVHPALLRGR